MFSASSNYSRSSEKLVLRRADLFFHNCAVIVFYQIVSSECLYYPIIIALIFFCKMCAFPSGGFGAQTRCLEKGDKRKKRQDRMKKQRENANCGFRVVFSSACYRVVDV